MFDENSLKNQEHLISKKNIFSGKLPLQRTIFFYNLIAKISPKILNILNQKNLQRKYSYENIFQLSRHGRYQIFKSIFLKETNKLSQKYKGNGVPIYSVGRTQFSIVTLENNQ